MKKGFFVLLLLLCSYFSVNAATNTIFYSYNTLGAGSYSWQVLTNWNTNRAGGGSNPVAADFNTNTGNVFVIQNGYTMNVTTTTNATIGASNKVWIENGGNVTATAAMTFNASATFQIDNGGSYWHSHTGTMSNVFAGTEVFGATSLIKVTQAAQITNGTTVSSPGVGNFQYAPVSGGTMACNAALPDIQGTLTIDPTTAGTLRLAGGVAGRTTYNVGNLVIANLGTLDFGNGTVNGLTMNISGDVTLTATGTTTTTTPLVFVGTGGTSGSPVSANIVFTKTGTQNFTNTNTSMATANYTTSFRQFNFTVNSGSILNMGTNVIYAQSTATNLNFTLSSGAGIILGDVDGIVAGGTNATTGNIRTSSTSTRTFNSGANYNFNGSVAQVTGTGFTGANNLTINNSAGVSLSAAAAVTGTLTFTSGKLDIGANNLTLTGATVSGASSSNYIVTSGAGRILRSIASGGGIFVFPIGRSSSTYNPVTITNTGASTSIYTVGAAASTYTTAANGTNTQWSIASGTSTTSTFAFSWTTSLAGANLQASPSSGNVYSYNGSTWGSSGGTTSTGTPNVTTQSGVTSGDTVWTVAMPASATAPTVTTTVASSITSTSASSGGNVTADGGATITERGIVYNTASTPTTANTKITASGTTGSFTSSLTGLTPGTTYYVRAYAINSVGTSYGSEISFTTLALPTVTTASATSITSTSASSGGNVTADGGASITERGVVYNTASTPTTANNKITTSGTTGSFTSSLSGLSPGTTYYVRAYAINSVGTSYGSEITFTTSTVAPTVTTTAISSITMTSASTGGNVTSDGGVAISERGVVYSTSSTPTTYNSKITDAGTTGAFTVSLSSLTAGTTYYVRAYAINSVGTSYGSEQSFTTLNTPTVTTTDASSVTLTGATSGGNVTSDGGSTVTERGVVYATTSNPTTSNTKITTTGTTGSFTSSITGLNPGVTYYVRAYAINNLGTSYGNEISFTTLTEAPTVTTSSISSITMTAASAGGNVTSDGGAAITERGVVYGTSTNPTTADTKITATGTTGSFTSSLTGLTPGTTYYVRAYAINSVGTSYGSEQSFTTLNIPTVSTASISIITSSSAYSGGNVTANGGSAITERGIVYSTTTNPTTSDTKITDGSATTGLFTSSITGLSASTTYYVRAYAINAQGTAYGSNVSFTTTSGAVAPGVTTAAVSNLGSSTVTVGGTLVTDGEDTVTERGIVYATSTDPTTADTKVTDAATSLGAYTADLTGLTPGTTYYVRAYATNSIGTSYGATVSFTMNAVLATVSTTAASSITSSSASTGGNVTADGGGNVTERGIVYGTSSNPTTSNTKVVDGSTGTGSFTSAITGLTQATTYYVRAYAINSAGTAYGSQQSFTTLANAPTVTTASISNLGSSTVTVGGSLVADGGDAVTERGIVYATSTDPTTADTKVIDASTAIGSYTADLTGLTPGATYYVRAYAINSIGTSYGATVPFTMNAVLATVSTTAASSITSSSASTGGNVTADGGGNVTERGIVYGTSSNPTTSNTKVVDGSTGTGSFTSAITGLTQATTYYVRAYAINSAGTAYGSQESFTTLANAPTVTTTSITAISGSAATSGGNVTSDGGDAITERGIVYSTSSNPTTADTKVINGTASTGSYTSSLTGLTALTTYYVRAYATNNIGTSYGSEVSFTTISAIPTIQASNVSFSNITLSGMTINFTAGDGANSIVVVKATSAVNSNPVNSTTYTANTTFGSGTQIGTGNYVVYAGTGNSVSITGLTAGTTYHVAVYAYNGSGGTENYITTSPATGNQATLSTNYRSVASGNWNATATWESFDGTSWNAVTSTPTSADGTIDIRSGHTVTVSASVTADEVNINAGGQLTVAAAQTLTIANGNGTDLTVNGYLKNQGSVTNNGQISVTGTYEHNVDAIAVPTATWNIGSTCLVTGITNNGASTGTAPGFNQNFYNFTWNNTSQSGSMNLGMFNNIISGDVNILSTGSGSSEVALSAAGAGTGAGTITILGNVTQNCTTNTNVFSGNRSGSAGTQTSLTVNVTGNLSITSGAFRMSNGAGLATTWNVAGNFSFGAGTFTSNANGTLHLTKSSGTITYSKTGGTYSGGTIIVDNAVTLDCGTSLIDGTVAFTLPTGATFQTGNTSGTLTTTGTKTLSATANYVFNGSSAQTLPAAITAANNITVNNAAGVTLGGTLAVTGTLTLTSGKLTLPNIVLTLSNPLVGGSSSNYIVISNSAMLKYLAVGNTATTYHIGNSATSYTPFTLTNTGTTQDISVGVSSNFTYTLLNSAKSVNLQWLVMPSGAGSIINATFNWNTANQGASFNNSGLGELGQYVTPGPYVVSSLGTLSGTSISKSGISLSNSVNYFAIGNTNAVYAPVIAGWDFFSVTSGSPPATYAATTFNSKFDATSSASNITRGAGAAASGANSSFRTTGFQNDGISTSNTDYFQVTLKPLTGYKTSLATIIANFAGTSSYYASPGASWQYAYSLDGTNYTLIGSPSTSLAASLTNQVVDVSGVSALQNVAAGTTIYIRYYASGQTTTGGWGFNSAASGTNGLAFTGSFDCVTPSAPTAVNNTVTYNGLAQTASATVPTGYTVDWYAAASGGSAISSNTTSTPSQTNAGTYTYYAEARNTSGSCTFVSTSRTAVTLTINKITPTLSISNSPQTYSASAISATVNGSVAGSVSNVKYDGSATVPTNAGTYAVTADFDPTDNTNYSSLTAASAGNFVINKATSSVTVTGTAPFSYVYDGTSKTPSFTSSGSTATITYAYTSVPGGTYSSTTAPANVGSYSVTASVAADANFEAASSSATAFGIVYPTNNWIGGDSNWNNTSNWSLSSVPLSTDNITISSGSPVLDVNHTIDSGRTLTISGTAALTINPNVILTLAGTADFGGKSVTLKSDATGTAAIGQVTGTLTGATNVTVERYIPAKRAWRALTAPLKGSNTSLYASWQNGGVSASPFNTGVELWGPSGTGMATGPAYNIRQYTTSGWADITNTQNTNLFTSSANNAYMVFVTGGYGSNNIGNGQSAATTLKATGQLITGTVNFPVTSARHTLVGNPFASPLSPSAILAGNTQANLYTNIWMWDPAISTNGAYVNYDASINSGTFSDNSGSYTSSSAAIQSGQAFFVRAVANTDTLTLTESMKSSSISNTFRNSISIAASVFRLGFAKQIGTEWMPLDGAIAAFYDSANPAVDPADGTKMVNSSENMALVRGTTNLSIEHYPLVNATDQLNVKIWNTQQAHYKLKLNTEVFTMVGVEAWLQDLYTGSSQPLNLDGSVQEYEFDVDPTVSASSGNRFRIVFTNTALAVTHPEQGQLSIYPNPATGGKVTVSLPHGTFEGCSYELINVLGQVVRQDEITNGNSSQVLIPLTGLPNSWYALRIRKDNKVVYQGKLIIKN